MRPRRRIAGRRRRSRSAARLGGAALPKPARRRTTARPPHRRRRADLPRDVARPWSTATSADPGATTAGAPLQRSDQSTRRRPWPIFTKAGRLITIARQQRAEDQDRVRSHPGQGVSSSRRTSPSPPFTMDRPARTRTTQRSSAEYHLPTLTQFAGWRAVAELPGTARLARARQRPPRQARRRSSSRSTTSVSIGSRSSPAPAAASTRRSRTRDGLPLLRVRSVSSPSSLGRQAVENGAGPAATGQADA